MTSISKNVYIDKLDEILNEYSNIYHSTIQRKPLDVESSRYTDSDKNNNTENPKFKVCDHARISKYKSIFG